MLDAGLNQTRQLPLEIGNPFEVRADELYSLGSLGNLALEDLKLAGRPAPMLHSLRCADQHAKEKKSQDLL